MDPGRGVIARVRAAGRGWRLLRALAWAVSVGAAAAMVFAWVWPARLAETGRAHVLISWAAFLVLTFWFHIGLALLPVAMFALALRMRRLLGLTAVLLAVTLGPAAWSLRPRGAPPAAGDSLVVMSANLFFGDMRDADLLDQIARFKPDVILFQEYTPTVAPRLRAALGERYPHVVEDAREDAFGQAVYSKRPFLGPPRLYPPGPGWSDPQIRTAIDLAGRPLPVMNIHLVPPAGFDLVREHRVQAANLAGLVREELSVGGAMVLSGDFNATTLSPHLRALRAAGVRGCHEEGGRGRGSTWPRRWRKRYLPGIRLDHILISDALVCSEAFTGGDFGSDHLPVLARLRWRDHRR